MTCKTTNPFSQHHTIFDSIIVGAGISGINTSYRIQKSLPTFKYKVLEARSAIGGTWDLFRYPGIRSDSDLGQYGFSWNPWTRTETIASGSSILDYLKESASLHGIDQHILLRHHVKHASWSSQKKLWILDVDTDKGRVRYATRFVLWASGYYNYHQPLMTKIPGLDNFRGRIIHPQFWPSDADYTGKRVVIIGSGATPVTLLASLSEKAAKTTMLQRSPSYVIAVPNRKQLPWLAQKLPGVLYHPPRRWVSSLLSRLFFLFCLEYPTSAKKFLRTVTERELPPNIPFDPHFKPRYNPFDHPLYISPDGDFFNALRNGKADVQTDTIRQVVNDGIELDSDSKIHADILVTATGLKVELFGETKIDIDGRPLHVSDKYVWHRMMIQDMPNSFIFTGYITSSQWTLGVDISARIAVRLMQIMQREDSSSVTAHVGADEKLESTPLFDLKSTYISKALKDLPSAATTGPWKPTENYLYGMLFAKFGNVKKGLLFEKRRI